MGFSHGKEDENSTQSLPSACSFLYLARAQVYFEINLGDVVGSKFHVSS